MLGQSLSSRVEMLAGTSGHYANKNNRNLIRSQKICVLFAALVVTKCDVVFGFFFPSEFYIKQFSEEGAYEYYYFGCLFCWLCVCMLAEPPLLPLVLSSLFDKGRLISIFLVL